MNVAKYVEYRYTLIMDQLKSSSKELEKSIYDIGGQLITIHNELQHDPYLGGFISFIHTLWDYVSSFLITVYDKYS